MAIIVGPRLLESVVNKRKSGARVRESSDGCGDGGVVGIGGNGGLRWWRWRRSGGVFGGCGIYWSFK